MSLRAEINNLAVKNLKRKIKVEIIIFILIEYI